jgi:prepilin-type N-terminal cleavage/methylation domain-containing protein
MRKAAAHPGYTLIETIVALLVFSVGGLALTSTAALLGRQLRVDNLRERAGRVAVSRIEALRASCAGAGSGSELVDGVRSEWSVANENASRLALVESVSYVDWKGARTDTYRALIECR